MKWWFSPVPVGGAVAPVCIDTASVDVGAAGEASAAVAVAVAAADDDDGEEEDAGDDGGDDDDVDVHPWLNDYAALLVNLLEN